MADPASMLLALPVELLQHIASFVERTSVSKLRLTCKELSYATFDDFATRWLHNRACDVTHPGRLQRLVDIASSERLIRKVRTLSLCQDPSASLADRLMSPDASTTVCLRQDRIRPLLSKILAAMDQRTSTLILDLLPSESRESEHINAVVLDTIDQAKIPVHGLKLDTHSLLYFATLAGDPVPMRCLTAVMGSLKTFRLERSRFSDIVIPRTLMDEDHAALRCQQLLVASNELEALSLQKGHKFFVQANTWSNLRLLELRSMVVECRDIMAVLRRNFDGFHEIKLSIIISLASTPLRWSEILAFIRAMPRVQTLQIDRILDNGNLVAEVTKPYVPLSFFAPDRDTVLQKLDRVLRNGIVAHRWTPNYYLPQNLLSLAEDYKSHEDDHGDDQEDESDVGDEAVLMYAS